MGMFDSVYADCPECGSAVEFQSKEGECYLNNYTIETAPTEVLRDVINYPRYCRDCGNWMALVDPDFPPDYMPPCPSPKAVKLRQPADGEFTAHKEQPYIRWWEPPFTFEDIARPDADELAQGEGS